MKKILLALLATILATNVFAQSSSFESKNGTPAWMANSGYSMSIGTTDAKDLNLFTNGVRQWKIDGTTGALTSVNGAPISASVGTLAATGNSQSTAAALSNQVTYGTACDATKGFRLPTGSIGSTYTVINTVTNNTCPIYPPTGGAINGGSANASWLLGQSEVGRFTLVAANTWYAGAELDPNAAISLPGNATLTGTLAVTGAQTLTGATALNGGATLAAGQTIKLDAGTLAALGNSQGTAAPIVKQVTYGTACDGTKGFTLPAGTIGEVYTIINTVTNAACPVYPPTSGTINGGSANAAWNLAQSATGKFVKVAANTWYAGSDLDTNAQMSLAGALVLASTLNVTGTSTLGNISFSGGLLLPNGNYESVAAAGNSQGTATAVAVGTKFHNVTGADGTKGVAWTATDTTVGDVHIFQSEAAAVLKIYPFTGGTINGGAANAAFSSATGPTLVVCRTTGTDTWHCA